MTLTREDYAILSKPFEAHEHEFREGSGNMMLCYITEEAITPHIIEVDPAFEITEPMVIQDKADNISVKVGITIKGVTRWGVGTSELKSFTGEPTKNAVTDAYKRAARLFGIGLYLQGLKGAKWVKDEATLTRWLNGEDDPATTQSTHRRQASPPKTGSGQSAATSNGFTEALTTLETRSTETGRTYFMMDGITMWSREPLRALGYDNVVITELEFEGTHELPDPIVIEWNHDKRGYKQPVEIKRLSTGELINVDTIMKAAKKASGQ
jgi:hypothetical protein